MCWKIYDAVYFIKINIKNKQVFVTEMMIILYICVTKLRFHSHGTKITGVLNIQEVTKTTWNALRQHVCLASLMIRLEQCHVTRCHGDDRVTAVFIRCTKKQAISSKTPFSPAARPTPSAASSLICRFWSVSTTLCDALIGHNKPTTPGHLLI